MALPSILKSGDVARLLPVVPESKKEAKAASVLLAILSSVKPYGEIMLGSIGQKVGKRTSLAGYTEVVFTNDNGASKSRPDGLLVVESGSGKRWTALIEAKIGRAELQADQIERYLALAKSQGIDAVITLSNQFATIPSHSPIKVSKSLTKSVDLYHWSWVFVWTQAKLLLNEDVFENDASKYLLTEMVRYFGHHSIGVTRFDRMNSGWKDLVTRIQAGAVIQKNDSDVEASVSAWHQEIRDLCLLLSRGMGTVVYAQIPRSHRDSAEVRMKEDSEYLIKNHRLYAKLDIPDAAAPLEIVADLLRRSVCVYMVVSAPKDKKKTSARLNWLLRQLNKTELDNVYIRANWPGRAPSTQASLKDLKEDVTLIEGGNKNLSPASFEVMLVHDMAGKFTGTKTFIEQLESAVPKFYKEVGQYLRAYVPPPPKLQSRSKTNIPQGINVESESLDPVRPEDESNWERIKSEDQQDRVNNIQSNANRDNIAQPPVNED